MREYGHEYLDDGDLTERGCTMNNAEQFEEFLHCLRTQKIKKIHLAELCLLVNPSAADFGSIVIEFENSMYWVTSKYLRDSTEDIDEFCAQKIESLEDIRHEITENDIYKTMAFEDKPISFVTELVDEEGYFNGLEFKTANYFLFLTVSWPCIIVHAANGEELKYLLYSHQFGEGDGSLEDGYVELFPEG
ncbi:MAG: hypothetical protein ACI3W5_07765 [Faecousia sp.]